MKDGGWILGEKRWEVHESQQERVREVTRAALDRCDRIQAGYPQCALCKQRAIHMDRFGLCSKTSQAHQEWRAAMLADEKVRVR